MVGGISLIWAIPIEVRLGALEGVTELRTKR